MVYLNPTFSSEEVTTLLRVCLSVGIGGVFTSVLLGVGPERREYRLKRSLFNSLNITLNLILEPLLVKERNKLAGLLLRPARISIKEVEKMIKAYHGIELEITSMDDEYKDMLHTFYCSLERNIGLLDCNVPTSAMLGECAVIWLQVVQTAHEIDSSYSVRDSSNQRKFNNTSFRLPLIRMLLLQIKNILKLESKYR